MFAAVTDWLEAHADDSVPYATAAAVVAAGLITGLSPLPSPLPGIALGSELLFYIERGVAILAVLILFLMLLVRGLTGDLPSEASTTGLGYREHVKKVASKSEAAVDDLAERLDKLDEARKGHVQALRLLHQMIQDVDKKVDGLQETRQ